MVQSQKCAMFKKQGTSSLPEVINVIHGTLAPQEFIASDQKQGNTISMTSSAKMGLNFWSKVGSPITLTSQWPQKASVIWLVLIWSRRSEPNASFQEKGNPTTMSRNFILKSYMPLQSCCCPVQENLQNGPLAGISEGVRRITK